MAVQATVTAQARLATRPSAAAAPWLVCQITQQSANSPTGRKVATAATPSRDSQEERHWLNARQARSGRPRCRVEESRPSTNSPSPSPKATRPNQTSAGSRPRQEQRRVGEASDKEVR